MSGKGKSKILKDKDLDWGDRTRVVHQGQVSLPKENHALVNPTFHSIKYYFDDIQQVEKLIRGEGTGFLYSRILNPTVRELELALAKLQGTEDCLCTSSGLAALSNTLIALLKSGDHLVYMTQCYKPTRELIEMLHSRFGVDSTRVSILDHEAIEKAIIPGKTKLMIWESPTNPQLEIADLAFLTSLCKKNGILSVMDNTFSGFHNHKQFEIDIYIHSLTKFASGHSDAMGGAVLGAASLVNRIRWGAMDLGDHFSAREASAIAKGLKTYFLRYERSSSNALQIANFLRTVPNVSQVRYPGLEDHPRHELAKHQQRDFGVVIMFDLKGGKQEVFQVINSLKIFKAAPSLGCVESLALPISLFFMSHLSDAELKTACLSESGIRLSVGIEDVRDLILDLQGALAKI
jgi:cystathionine beta-lyase/cystathionine gamma-synthase